MRTTTGGLWFPLNTGVTHLTRQLLGILSQLTHIQPPRSLIQRAAWQPAERNTGISALFARAMSLLNGEYSPCSVCH